MKQKELKARTEQLLNRFKKLLGDFREIQIEMRKMRDEAQSIAKENPILASFVFLVLSLNADYLEKLNNLNLSSEMIDRALEVINQKSNKPHELYEPSIRMFK